MRILTVGDVVADCGVDYVRRNLKSVIRENNVDFTVINGENSLNGKGISKEICDMFFDEGCDCVTLGNHAFSKKNVKKAFETYPNNVIRPINMGEEFPGKGYTIVNKDGISVGIINAIGRIYMKEALDPFEMTKNAVDALKKEGVEIIIADFHGEATSEKKAFGYFFDGKISVVFGTHTHTPTADEQIFRGGTGFISDIGMTGSQDGILGLKKEISINKIVHNQNSPFEWCNTNPLLQGAIFDVDNETGKCINVTRITY